MFRRQRGDIRWNPGSAPAPIDPDGLERPSANASEQEREDFRQKRKALIEEHRGLALTDDFGHGTHVAGIIAGAGRSGSTIRLLERVEEVTAKGELERGQFKQTGTLPAQADLGNGTKLSSDQPPRAGRERRRTLERRNPRSQLRA